MAPPSVPSREPGGAKKRGKYTTLTLEKEAAIIKLIESGRSQLDVAKKYHLSKQTPEENKPLRHSRRLQGLPPEYGPVSPVRMATGGADVLERQGSAEALHFESFHDLDSDMATSPDLTDSKIVAAVVLCEFDDENEDDDVKADSDPSPSLTAVADAMAVMRAFAEKKGFMARTNETWVNAGHTKETVWTDTKVMSRKDAFRQGLSTGLREPSGKRGRLIALHAGSAEGFVDEAALVFCAKGAGDYHTEMDAALQKWFAEQLLLNLKPRSVIKMDNASCHSAQVEKVPSSIIKKSRQLVIHTLASAAGHEVVRLPPYHCELNPTELVWSQVKAYVASKNTDFKLDSVEKLLLEGITGVTLQNWFQDCTHVIRLEDEAWEGWHYRQTEGLNFFGHRLEYFRRVKQL
ncbi:hypothetical protein HPB50_005355 [Hyalomma asiaticum]|uniref:Uncharacterized protein n=1 Tax=Hyalomma asiaticum TaxID=266040 RepID=A0ACB7SEB1_HYAAI|nr:hypothetical protein HPB50_005355 [Hyalomma asiaticum]